MKTKEKKKERKVKTKEKKERKVKTKQKKERKVNEGKKKRKAKERKVKKRKKKKRKKKKRKQKGKKERQKVRESKRFKNTTNNVPRKEVKQTSSTSHWKCSRISVGMLFAGTPPLSSTAAHGSMTKKSIGG